MKVPRWTVYPAIATIVTLVVTAVPEGVQTPANAGAAMRARQAVAAQASRAAVEAASTDEPKAEQQEAGN